MDSWSGYKFSICQYRYLGSILVFIVAHVPFLGHFFKTLRRYGYHFKKFCGIMGPFLTKTLGTNLSRKIARPSQKIRMSRTLAWGWFRKASNSAQKKTQSKTIRLLRL